MLSSDNSTGWHVCEISFCTLINLTDQGVYLTVAGSWHGNSDSHFSSTCCVHRGTFWRLILVKVAFEAHFEESGSGERWAPASCDIIPPTAETHAVTAVDAMSSWAHAPGARMVCFSILCDRGKCGVSGTQTPVRSVFSLGLSLPIQAVKHTHQSACTVSDTVAHLHTRAHTQGKSCACYTEGVGG